MLLRPLRRSNEAVLFRVPACNHDRALRRPATLERRAKTARHLELRGRPRVGIDSPVRPRVAVIAEDDQLLWLTAPFDSRDDVVDRLQAFIHLNVHRHGRGAWADVIREW